METLKLPAKTPNWSTCFSFYDFFTIQNWADKFQLYLVKTLEAIVIDIKMQFVQRLYRKNITNAHLIEQN